MRALTSGSEAPGWEAVQKKVSGRIRVRSLFLPSPPPHSQLLLRGGGRERKD